MMKKIQNLPYPILGGAIGLGLATVILNIGFFRTIFVIALHKIPLCLLIATVYQYISWLKRPELYTNSFVFSGLLNSINAPNGVRQRLGRIVIRFAK